MRRALLLLLFPSLLAAALPRGTRLSPLVQPHRPLSNLSAAAARRRLQLAAAANHTVTLASPRLGLSHGLASWLVDWSSVNVGTVSTVPIASLVLQSPTGVAVSEDTLSVFVGDFDAGTIVQADIATGVVTRTLDAPSPGLLARSAGLSIKQVNDWFTNYRKRHWEQELVKAQALDFDDHSASSGSS